MPHHSESFAAHSTDCDNATGLPSQRSVGLLSLGAPQHARETGLVVAPETVSPQSLTPATLPAGIDPKPACNNPEPVQKAVRTTLQSAKATPKALNSAAKPQPQSSAHSARPIALLSFFDGIATAHQALLDLKIEPVVSWSWETNEACRQVVKARHPRVVQFGDALETPPDELVARLRSACPADTLVLVCAAPPCHDFTIMKGDLAAGIQGAEGNKFVQWSGWWRQFKAKSPFPLVLLVENVVPSTETQQALDECLGIRSFLCDAASWGLVSRPRLWWSDSIRVPAKDEAWPDHLLSGLARWRKWNRQWELLPCAPQFPRQLAAECPCAKFHEDICSGRIRYPCLTTPAATEEGRAAPRKRKRAESPETMRRWQEGGKQYPPWQYRSTALVTIQGSLCLPDPRTREFLHGFPQDYTAPACPRSRCLMLGNSWHLPTCRFLLFTLLVLNQALQVTAFEGQQWYPPVSCPRFEAKYHPDGSRPILRARSWWLRSGLPWDPNEPTRPNLAGPADNAERHAQWALALTWEDVFPLAINPCLKWALDQQDLMGSRLHEWREAVSQDVRALVCEVCEDQDEWLALAPAHVQQVYKQGTDRFVVQLLPFAVLLQLFQFPEWDQLVCEMFHGFRMLGPLTPGAQWHLRTDAKYARPIGVEQFKAFNSGHAQVITRSSRTDEHTDRLRSEVAAEAKVGRFQGPWSREYLQQHLLPSRGFVAKAFPIVQGDKVRRGDDWLRSGHNGTVWASDTPPYMGTSTILAGVRYRARKCRPHLAAVDHEGAYRGLPVRDPAECCTVLPGESEGSVWQHTVLPFGATSSVWAYLRVADAICFLSIALLLLAAAHFVDDFFMVEGADSAQGGFASFKDMHAALGFRNVPHEAVKRKAPCAKTCPFGC